VSSKTRCKECVKANARKNRAENIEHYKEFDRKRANRPDRVEARKQYAKTEQGKEAGKRAKRSWTERNPKKRQANMIVGNAISSKKISKPKECEECSVKDVRLEGHHDDYNKPLEVRWLCSACHRAWHKENGPGVNAA
jgi:hypothetical protein